MTCQGVSLGLVSIGCCCFSFLSLEGWLLFGLHTECLGDHGVSLSRIFPLSRIFEFFLHTENRGDHGFSYYHELSNYRISFTRIVADCRVFFLFTRLVLGPTDQREVIAEFLSITRSVADGCGACSSCEWGLFVVVYRPIRGVCV